MGKIFVVGVGPGSKAYLTPAAVAAVEKADILVGGRRALSLFDANKPKKLIDGDVDGVISYLKENSRRNTAVLTSGDPGFYSILNRLAKEFPKEDIEVIPGVSSMQLCFARVSESWSDAIFLTAHGRDIKVLLEGADTNKTLVFLTDAASSPQKIAELLLRRGMGNRRAVVGEDLSGAGERLVDATLKKISRGRFTGNSVMVVFHG